MGDTCVFYHYPKNQNKKKIKCTEFEVLNDFNNIDTILDNLNKILKGLIIDLEKEIDYTINSINLMIDSPLNLYIDLSVKKNFVQTKITFNFCFFFTL